MAISYLTKRRPRTTTCQCCKTKFAVKPKGRVPKFCGQSCKQKQYLRRRFQPRLSLQLLERDIASRQLRDTVRTEVAEFLKEYGVVLPRPRAIDGPPKTRPQLRVVSTVPPDPEKD